jgi:pilus assembly protein Flp/PilA
MKTYIDIRQAPNVQVKLAADAFGERKSDRSPQDGFGNMFSQPRDEVVQMKKFIVAFLKDEEGLTMVEYAIAGALVSIAAVTAFTNLGTAVATRIGALVTAVNS